MGKAKQIEFKSVGGHSGIQVEYVKSRKMLHFFAWYDTHVGIEGGQMTLEEFCKQLDIRLR